MLRATTLNYHLQVSYIFYYDSLFYFFFFFFTDTAPTEIYTLSLHDALPICACGRRGRRSCARPSPGRRWTCATTCGDRKSTRLNSSHQIISYAVFCLKKKKKKKINEYY